jgi:polyisoprenoid-binding protein YceI
MTMTQTAPFVLRPGRWLLDANHSSVGFAVRHLGVSMIRGRFGRFDAGLVVGDTIHDSSLVATVDLSSIDTGNRDRDAHVLAPELLDVERRQTMTFQSTAITGAGEQWRVHGDLTIGDVTGPLALDVTFGGVEAFFDGTRHAGFEAVGAVRRSEFGIEFPGVGTNMLGDRVDIVLDIQLIEPS